MRLRPGRWGHGRPRPYARLSSAPLAILGANDADVGQAPACPAERSSAPLGWFWAAQRFSAAIQAMLGSGFSR